MEDIVVSDVLLTTDQGRITVFDLPDQPGNCSQVFQAVAAGGIVVDMIVQNLTGGGGRAVVQRAARRPGPGAGADRRKRPRRSTRRPRSSADANIAKLFVLGVGMRTHTGVARRMFGALAQRGINISMINTSEVRVSVVVDRVARRGGAGVPEGGVQRGVRVPVSVSRCCGHLPPARTTMSAEVFVMSRLVALLALCLFALPARACPMCAESAPQKSSAEQTDQQREAAAYNQSIYLMAGMPLLMLACGSFWVGRALRRHAAAEAQAARHAADEGGRACSLPSPADDS